MKAEMLEQPKKETDGIRHEPGIEYQTIAAVKNQTEPNSDMLMNEVLQRENLLKALKRVKDNKGSPGVDGMTVEALTGYLKVEWPRIREELLKSVYTPQPVLRVDIPKPGGGDRMLGIPSVLDRLIGQAVLQVLSPVFEVGFSEFSYGFRPGRSAHDAVRQAKEYIRSGYRWVVDIDLEKFFDQVNHDILMSLIARKIDDKRLLKLIRKYLEAGIMAGGIVTQRLTGTPQGSPLSPMLSNILLDELDKELTKRGHVFCRYADDSNIYVRSKKAGDRVMASIVQFIEGKLKLKVNRSKSAVARPWKRKYLGYTFTDEYKARPKLFPESFKRVKVRIREITGRRARGQKLIKVIEEVNKFLRGWFNYFRLTEVMVSFKLLDQWIRRRLRKLLWRQWKKPKTRFKKMVQHGVYPSRARKAAAGGRGPWFNAGASHMHTAIPNRLLAQWGLISLVQKHKKTLCA